MRESISLNFSYFRTINLELKIGKKNIVLAVGYQVIVTCNQDNSF